MMHVNVFRARVAAAARSVEGRLTAGEQRRRSRAWRRPRRLDRRVDRPPYWRWHGGKQDAPRGFLVTRLRWMIVVTLVVVAGALMLTGSGSTTYRATTAVLVQPRLFSVATAPQPADMGTEKSVAASSVVVERAARALDIPPADLVHGMSVSVPLNTTILRFAYSSATPRAAQAGSQALADSYVAYWLSQQPAKVNGPKTDVISKAGLPTSAVGRSRTVEITLAVVIGLLLALGTALIRDRLDDRLRGPGDLKARAGAPILALVPPVRRSRRNPRGGLVMVRSPASRAAEAYNDLRTRVLRIATRRGAKTLLVTSPAGEDKATVAANLAAALALSGQQVVLVCADLRWSRVHELFGVENDEGLAAVLDGRADIAAVVRATDIPGLQLIPAGRSDRNDGAAVQTPTLRWMISQVRAAVDFVVIEAPPVLAGADTGALIDLVETVLLVADARKTTREQVRAAMTELEHAQAKLIGCALDNVGRRCRLPKPPVSPSSDRSADLSPADLDDPEWLLDEVTDAPPAEPPAAVQPQPQAHTSNGDERARTVGHLSSRSSHVIDLPTVSRPARRRPR